MEPSLHRAQSQVNAPGGGDAKREGTTAGNSSERDSTYMIRIVTLP